ncbi:molybdenum cofactor synthesis 2 [Marasmius fiardii PR-910]|nr:molybdenum cofactor synthesis 2 [Marasmius fiardii PR-910]
MPSLEPSASFETKHESPGYICAISYTLNVDEIIKSVGDDAAGANVFFIGTTRDTFRNKVVTRLEYQAYSKLAIKTMSDIIESARNQSGPDTSKSLIRCAVHHRIGTVPVGEASIVIAVSAPHRKEAFSACEFILEEVKKKAQIWKREYYEGDEATAEWKANA